MIVLEGRAVLTKTAADTQSGSRRLRGGSRLLTERENKEKAGGSKKPGHFSPGVGSKFGPQRAVSGRARKKARAKRGLK